MLESREGLVYTNIPRIVINGDIWAVQVKIILITRALQLER